MLETLFMIILFMTAIFLIVLVLIQRGKGGGLAGAFGGLGGQSAFGTKAGDLFTRITIGVAAFWIILCVVTVKFLPAGDEGGDDMFKELGGGGERVEGGMAPAEGGDPQPGAALPENIPATKN